MEKRESLYTITIPNYFSSTALIFIDVVKRLEYLAGVINTGLSLLTVKSSAIPKPSLTAAS